MERKLRICSTCRSEYRFCPRCNEDKDKPNWYFAFCSENCKDIYDVTSNYGWGNISAKEAKERISKLDLSKIENFGESYQNTIAKINSYEEMIAKPTILEVDAELNVKDITDATEVVEVVVENTTKKPRKAKKNVEVE